jgi:hypothetical protein
MESGENSEIHGRGHRDEHLPSSGLKITNPGPQVQLKYRQFVRPTRLGLPNWKVVVIPLLALFIPFALLVIFGITGSSTGYLRTFFETGDDARLLFGFPKGIRSDEWLVHSGWVISQVQQGLPALNMSLFGGVETAFLQELPTYDWTMIFRPQLWGFFFLPFDQAAAIKWWLPIFAMMAAAFFLFISLVPKRPFSAFILAIAFAFNPFIQWWFSSNTVLPIAFSFFAGAAVVWCIRGSSRLVRWLLGALLGYSFFGMAMGLYVPFILPAALPGLALAIGLLLDRGVSTPTPTLAKKLKSVVPLFVGLVGGMGLFAYWIVSHWELVNGFSSTVYPGARETLTGGADFSSWVSVFGAPFGLSIFDGASVPLFGSNSSEASTFFLPGFFLLVPLVWLAVKRFSVSRRRDALLISQLILLSIVVAFLAIPGWDAVAQLFLLDLIPVRRFHMFFGVMSFILVAIFVARIDEFSIGLDKTLPKRMPTWVKFSAPILAAISVFSIWGYALYAGPGILITSLGELRSAFVTLVVVGLFIAAVALIVWRQVAIGAIALLLATGATTILVNPVYVGLYDLNSSELVDDMKIIDDQYGDDATWVGVGDSFLTTAAIMHSGLTGVNGVQNVPLFELWQLVDPSQQYDEVWNRLGHITWTPGSGEPIPTNPSPDTIKVNFDSCSDFAQENINLVVAEGQLKQNCLRPLKEIKMGTRIFYIYSVVQDPTL